MKKSCSRCLRQLRARSLTLSALRGLLLLLALTALSGLFLLPEAAVPLGLGMVLALGLWMGSYALEAALLSACGQSHVKW